MADYLSGVNGIAIHVRRGDMLSVNGDCYKYDYFKRAMKVIRENVDYPVFDFLQILIVSHGVNRTARFSA